MSERLKVKLLLAIWGDRYIREFGQVALPSWMAPGNLPALAAEADVEILVMTTDSSRDTFETDPKLARLRRLCPIRYIGIDDLITSGNYGVTLTLAFARGIRDSGEDQVNTTFMFMNSDFILADGSLRTLAAKLKEGHRCVLAPSLRASSEPILPILASKVDRRRGILSMAPRDMVRMTFDHLHPTVIGKTVTQDLSTCLTHNQIYWQVDETALLARYFLVFMLAIRPETPLGPINSYCDYGFIPEMVPSGKFVMLDDSDDFYMLELQATQQESGLLRAGRSRPEEIARQLSSWTTREHRRFGEVDVLFHTHDRPAELDIAKSDLAAFVAQVKRHFRRSPLEHVDHYYWVLGLRAWTSLKSGDMPWLINLPPEVGKPYSSDQVKGALSILSAESRISLLRKLPSRAYTSLVYNLRNRANRAPNVPVWDHLWQDYRLVRQWARSQSARHPEGRTLVICDDGSPFDRYFSRRPGYEVKVGLDELIDAPASDRVAPTPEDHKYSTIFLHVYRANMRKTRKLLKAIERLLKSEGKIVIFVEHRQSEIDPSNFSYELTQYLTEFLPTGWAKYRAKTRFVGGPLKRRLRLAEKRAFEYARPTSFRGIPKFIAGLAMWPVVAALTTANNLWHRNASSECPDYCSSFLISFERKPVNAHYKPSLR